MMAVCVDPAKINEFWPYTSHFIREAYASGIGDDDFEKTERDVLSGQALLWLAWDGERVLAAAVTKLDQLPAKKICRVVAVSGNELARWASCLTAIENYAKQEACDGVRLSGRPGWRRIFTGYSQPFITLEKRI